MTERTVVQFGTAKIRVPVYVDERTTQLIAERVNGRLKEIEAESDRIDTQAFALRAAFQFASDLHHLQSQVDLDQREMAVHLDRILSRLRELVGEFGEGQER